MMSFAGNGLMQLGYDEPESCEGVAKDYDGKYQSLQS